MDHTIELMRYCKSIGLDLAGVADLAPFKAEKACFPENLLDDYTFAVSVGIRLDDEVLNVMTDRPTPRYDALYQDVNARLDAAAENVVQWIRGKGCKALAIPASKILDASRRHGSISHKAIGHAAGLGWQGKSLLLVNPDLGPRFRLASILTDLDLTPGVPVKNQCGSCHACADACPARAIKNVSTKDRYATCEEAVDLDKCNRQLNEFGKLPGISHSVCGVCVIACPFGKKTRKKLSHGK
nr:4Fe-4S double cluster binding domain-containing protein [Candidatus Sigynarchaeota archaeon]